MGELGVVEGVAEGGEFFGVDVSAGEEGFASHFAEGESDEDGRHRDDGGAMEVSSEGLGELGVGDGLRGDDVDGALGVGSLVNQEIEDGGDFRGGDPGEVLTSLADPSSEAEPEGEPHFFQGTSGGIENHAKAKENGADSPFLDAEGFRLPGLACFGQEALSGRGGFRGGIKDLGAVEAGRRGAEEGFGWGLELGEGFRQVGGALDSAGGDALLFLSGPKSVGDVVTGEVDDDIGLLHGLRVEPTRRGIPRDGVRKRFVGMGSGDGDDR